MYISEEYNNVMFVTHRQKIKCFDDGLLMGLKIGHGHLLLHCFKFRNSQSSDVHNVGIKTLLLNNLKRYLVHNREKIRPNSLVTCKYVDLL